MNQLVRTTIRWNDQDGNTLGAFCEREINLPSWGKKDPMRKEIVEFIKFLSNSSDNLVGTPKTFSDYAFKAFRPENIVQIKSKTTGSYIHLRNDELAKFIKDNGL